MAQQPRFYASLQGEVRTLLLVTGLISAGAALTAAYFAVAKPGPRSSKMSREALIELLKASIENGLVARREAMATVVSAERSGKAATVSSVVDVYRERLTALDAEACARAGVQPADAAEALRYHGSAADVRVAEASVLATHPLRLAGDAAALAAALDLPAGGGRAEAAVTLAELGALVASVTAAAPACIGPALQAVQAEQHGSEAEAIASVADKARALATRRLLAASPVWRGRPAAFSWAAQLHCATDAAAAAAYKREVLATHGAVVEALQRMSDPSAGGEGGMMMGMD